MIAHSHMLSVRMMETKFARCPMSKWKRCVCMWQSPDHRQDKNVAAPAIITEAGWLTVDRERIIFTSGSQSAHPLASGCAGNGCSARLRQQNPYRCYHPSVVSTFTSLLLHWTRIGNSKQKVTPERFLARSYSFYGALTVLSADKKILDIKSSKVKRPIYRKAS